MSRYSWQNRKLEHYPTKLDRQNRDSQRETDERVCFQA
jgi:hypothetical protein